MFDKIKIFDHGARRSGGKLKKVVKCDVKSYIKILYIENSNDYYYQVIHKSFPHFPHYPQFPHISILNKKFTNTKQHISIKSIIVIIPNFLKYDH